jgi:hypothetical protein
MRKCYLEMHGSFAFHTRCFLAIDHVDAAFLDGNPALVND